VVARIGSNAALAWQEGGDHSFAVKGLKRVADDAGASLAHPAAEFLRKHR
jgi:hypothetical protein